MMQNRYTLGYTVPMRVPNAQKEAVARAKESFPGQLREYRKSATLTQAAAAAMLGVSAIAWRKWEAGERYPLRMIPQIEALIAKSEAAE